MYRLNKLCHHLFQGKVQDLHYIPTDMGAYESTTRYCPDCDYEFPDPDPNGFVIIDSAEGRYVHGSDGGQDGGGAVYASATNGEEYEVCSSLTIVTFIHLTKNFLLIVSTSITSCLSM